jgi:hypothetical protein
VFTYNSCIQNKVIHLGVFYYLHEFLCFRCIEEVLFIKTPSGDIAGNTTFTKYHGTTKHTNYAAASYNKRIEILMKFFAHGRYKTNCDMLELIHASEPFDDVEK